MSRVPRWLLLVSDCCVSDRCALHHSCSFYSPHLFLALTQVVHTHTPHTRTHACTLVLVFLYAWLRPSCVHPTPLAQYHPNEKNTVLTVDDVSRAHVWRGDTAEKLHSFRLVDPRHATVRASSVQW